jgi:hypothetical protein
MSAGASQEHERFAAAVERGGPVSASDEQLRQELELVALLRKSGTALGPDADASARMRARVMAAAAEIMSERSEREAAADAPTVIAPLPHLHPSAEAPVADVDEAARTTVVPIGRARGRHRFTGSGISASQRKRGLLGVGAAAAVMALAVAGGGALFSQNALPGDSLYGVKQTTESALVGLTPGQGNKAQRQLDYAATRLDEVQKLNTQAAPPERASDIGQALRGFDEQTQAGSRMWLASHQSSGTSKLAKWAQAQSERLAAMRSSMPAAAQPDADHSMRVLEDVRTRAQSLSNRQGCDSVTTGRADQLGPLPAKGACATKGTVKAPATPSLDTPEASTSADKASSGSRSESATESSGSREGSAGRHGNHDQTRRDDTIKESTPRLPSLDGLTDGTGSAPVPALPRGMDSKGGGSVPSSPAPVLNLPLLLPGL